MFKNSEEYQVETKRKGRRVIGDLLTFKNGKKAYIYLQSLSDIYKDGEKSISAAMRLGTACWAIDQSELMMLEMEGVSIVGIRVRSSDDVYMIDIKSFSDYSIRKSARLGRRSVICIPMSKFKKREGKLKI